MYQSLIFFLNRHCPVGCPSCSAAAAPKKQGVLGSRWLEAFFRKVETGDLDFSGYIVWTGGEPFLSIGSLEAGIQMASRAGYHSEILTSGVWFDAHPQYLERLASVGAPSLRISLDAEHQETVPLDRLTGLIRLAVELGLTVNFTLREIPGRHESASDSMAEIKRQLPQFYEENSKRSRWIHYVPHVPILTNGQPSSSPIHICPGPDHEPTREKKCRMAYRDLVIGADGLVYPCCGFFGLPFYRELAVGNPLEESWETLSKGQSRHSLYAPCHSCLDRYIRERNA
ncbi:MAG: radical SAM protein [bacterium]|nr:radical SAM protein [bacterium]